MRTIPHTLKVGDDVSYGFNGDYYPDGKITRFTKTGKYLYTDGGTKYVKTTFESRERMEDTGEYEDVIKEGFQRVGGTWWLVPGIVSEQNPHF